MLRTLDLALAALGLLLSLPLLLAAMVAIRLESAGPAVFAQVRVGRGQRQFTCYKLRSMAAGTRQGASHEVGNATITRVGAFLRRTKLDELPQLWNVLRGDMSLVGPRPERPQFVAELVKKIRYYELRHCVKPGLAGWAQLNYPYGATEEDAAEKLKYDLFYVKNHDLVFDILILLQTVEVIILGKGAR